MENDEKLEEIDLNSLEELIINYTKEIIEHIKYQEILKDIQEEEITKTYKLK